MHVNMDYKKGHFTYFFQEKYHFFLGKKQETRTNNLHHHKAGSVAVILRVHHIQKKCAIIFSTRWPPNIHCFLKGLLLRFITIVQNFKS